MRGCDRYRTGPPCRLFHASITRESHADEETSRRDADRALAAQCLLVVCRLERLFAVVQNDDVQPRGTGRRGLTAQGEPRTIV